MKAVHKDAGDADNGTSMPTMAGTRRTVGVYDAKIQVIVVDDHDLMRKVIGDVLAMDEQIEVVADAADARGGLALAAALSPDVIIVDFVMPEKDGFELVEELRALSIHKPVLILSVHKQESLVRRAQNAGAQGYVVKRAMIDQLVPAVRTVSEGQTYFQETGRSDGSSSLRA